jgi:hypothetical protein
MYLRLALARNTYNSRPCDYAMSRPQNGSADARSSGQGRPARRRRGLFAASRPLLEGCEHGGPLQRFRAERRGAPHRACGKASIVSPMLQVAALIQFVYGLYS